MRFYNIVYYSILFLSSYKKYATPKGPEGIPLEDACGAIHKSTKFHQNNIEPIPEDIDAIGKLIVDAAYTVHKNIGPGLLEKIYEICFCHELTKRGLSYRRQIDIPVVYDGLVFNEGLRLDVLVENEIICELKAIETVNPVWEAQVLSHLKLTNKRLGYLINFNVVNIGKGIKRFAN